MMPASRTLVVTALLCVSTCPAASVYPVSTGQQFETLNLVTGGFHRIGPSLPEESSGLVSEPNGGLLSLSFSGNLNLINPANGLTTLIGATGLGDCNGPSSPCPPNSATFLTQFNGTIYATDLSSNLYKVDPATGATLLLGPTGIPPIPFKDGFDAGTLDTSNGNIKQVIAPALYQLAVTTGTALRIGATDFGIF